MTNSLRYSCLEDSRDAGAWQSTVHELPNLVNRTALLVSVLQMRTLEHRRAKICAYSHGAKTGQRSDSNVDHGCSPLGSVEWLSDREYVCVCVFERERVFFPNSTLFHWLGSEEVSGHVILRSHIPQDGIADPHCLMALGWSHIEGCPSLCSLTLMLLPVHSELCHQSVQVQKATVRKLSLKAVSLFESNLSFYSFRNRSKCTRKD